MTCDTLPTARQPLLLLLATMLALTAARTAADVVRLHDGSRLVGSIEQVAGGRLVLATGFAGKLEIPLDKVEGYATEGELCVGLEDGTILQGRVTAAGQEATVSRAGEASLANGRLAAAWQPGKPNPLLPPRPRWKREAGISLAGRSGNSDTERLGLSLGADIQSKTESLKLFADWAREEKNSQRTTDKYGAGLDFEARFATRGSWYARQKLERDNITNLQLRSVTALGYGHYFVNRPEALLLRGRVGGMFRHETYRNPGGDISAPGIDLGILADWRINKSMRLVSDVSFTPAFEDVGDYNINHKSSLDIPLGGSAAWKLRLGLGHEYESRPQPGVRRLDTTWFADVVYAF